MWKERQSQFAREELHMKQSLEKLQASEGRGKAVGSKTSLKSKVTKSTSVMEGSHVGSAGLKVGTLNPD